MDAERAIKSLTRRFRVEIMAYRRSVPARRTQLLHHLGVDLVVDVGANVGQYATELRSTGYDRRLLSIEPLAEAHRQLAAQAADDPLWDTEQLAVGDSEGELVLHVSSDDVYSSSLPLADRATQANDRASYTRDQTAAVKRLDDILAARRPTRLAVKIDVQGYERQVLDGAPGTLQEACFLEMELTPRPLYEGQLLMREALQRAEAAGLTLALVENVFPDFETGEALQFNGIFIRR